MLKILSLWRKRNQKINEGTYGFIPYPLLGLWNVASTSVHRSATLLLLLLLLSHFSRVRLYVTP